MIKEGEKAKVKGGRILVLLFLKKCKQKISAIT